MADNSVDSAEYTDRSIDSEHYASGSVDDTAIGLDAVGNSELANDSVDANAIRESVVYGSLWQSTGGPRRHLATNSIGQGDIGPNAVGTGELKDLEVTTEKIENLGITTGKINNGAVTSAKLGTDSVITSKIDGRAVTEPKLAVNSVTYFQIDTAVFGTGFSTAARGNHTHSISVLDTAFSGHGHGIGNDGSHGHAASISSSSLRFKNSIEDYSVEDLKEKLFKLKFKKYKYNNAQRDLRRSADGWNYGYIAEDVDDIGLKEIIAYDRKNRPAALDYGLLSSLILEIVKVQQNEIDSLKEQLNKLTETK